MRFAVSFLIAMIFAIPTVGQEERHVISAGEGQAMIQAYQAQKASPGGAVEIDWDALTVSVAALRALMAQDGAVRVRLFHALNNGRRTLVAAAVDADGYVLVGPTNIMLENFEPCPPFCYLFPY